MNKNILIIVVLIIIIGGGIMAWQFWPDPKDESESKDWLIYQNEELGINFEYPKAWGEITTEFQRDYETWCSIKPETQKSHLIDLSASNEDIYGIWHHASSGNTFFIERGDLFTIYGGEDYQGIVRVIYPDKSMNTIYADKEGNALTRYISISPDGKYLSVSERFSSHMINIETGQIITDEDSARGFTGGLLFCEDDIYWSTDNRALVVKSYHEPYGGVGIDGLFASDYGNPDILNEVYIIPAEKSLEGVSFHNISFIDDKEICFGVGLSETGAEEYIYNTETKKLIEK